MKANRYIMLPEDWDELTEADWQELLKMRQQMVDKQLALTLSDVRIEAARILLENRGMKTQTGNQQYLILVSQLARSLDWLWKEQDGTLSLCYRSVLNKLPKIGEWTGPADCGTDITFGEFRMAVAVLRNYEQHPSERDLNVLAGLLYRPEASEQMQHEQQLRRWPYDWDTFEQKERRGEQMQRWQVWGVYAWFAYFCEALTTATFILEGEEVCFAPLFEQRDGGKGGERTGNGLQQICLTLAESHVFGTARDVDHTLLLTVMQKLLLDYQTLQRLKDNRLKMNKQG